MFYFAGHGYEWDNRNWLLSSELPANDSKPQLESRAVDAQYIFSNMQDEAHFSVLILDCCRVAAPEVKNIKTMKRGGSRRGLGQMKAPKGGLIAYACAQREEADDGEGRNGTYTKHLLKHIGDEARVEDIFIRVRNEVKKETNGKQNPWTNSSIEVENARFC